MFPQSAQPAYLIDDEEGPRGKWKAQSRGLARKLKGVFRRQRLDVQSSSAQLTRHHGKDLQGTPDKKVFPEHGQPAEDALLAFDAIEHLDPGDRHASLRARRRKLTIEREGQAIRCECVAECPCTCDLRTDQVPEAKTPKEDKFGYLPAHNVSSTGGATQEQRWKPNQNSTTQEQKRRRRRESHNLVERRRRDNINDRLQELSHLVPLHRFKDYNTKLSRYERTGESVETGPSKADILNESVKWTRDLMWALHRKLQQQPKAREYIDSLGGTWPFEFSEGERRLQKEVTDAFDANGEISLSRPWDSEINAERSVRLESWKSAINANEANHSEPALHTKASHGSLISFSGSVQSFTSLTYRSVSGEIKTEHAENVSNFVLSRPRDKLGAERRELGALRRHSMLPFLPATDDERTDAGQGFVRKTQTFVTSPIYKELDEAPSLDRDQDGKSSRLTPDSHFSLVSPRNSQRLDEVDFLATGHLIDEIDSSIQPQMQSHTAAKMDQEVGPGSSSLHEDSLLGTLSSMASSDSRQDLVESDTRVTYLENKLIRLRWKCSCNHPFQMDVFEHEKGAALAAIQELDQSNLVRDEPLGLLHRLFMFVARVKFLLHVFSNEREINEQLPITNPLPIKADDIIHTRQNPAIPDPQRYVCICFPGMTYKKYLHHVDVNKTVDDQHLFAAIQRKYRYWKPLWRRIVTLRTLARVEYFEFKIYDSNLVTIKDDWRDRFPQGHDPGEWSYNPTSRDMTPYLIDDVLTHYVHNPQCAKMGKYFWNRIPKKVFCKLECPDDKPFKIGWGLYFVEEFSQFYLMLVLVPVLAAGFALATWSCIRFRRSFADGATVVSGFAAVVMYFFSVAQGWYRQKGAL